MSSYPVKSDLWETSNDVSHLIGSICNSCKEVFFPQKFNNLCSQCQGRDLAKVKLSLEGIIVNFTVVYQKPGGNFYKGTVPYAYGVVELPEGVRVLSLFTECDPEELQMGLRVKLVIDKLYKDEDQNEVLTYKFKVVR